MRIIDREPALRLEGAHGGHDGPGRGRTAGRPHGRVDPAAHIGQVYEGGRQVRERIDVVVGAVAGVFSLVLGLVYVLGLDGIVPEIDSILPF